MSTLIVSKLIMSRQITILAIFAIFAARPATPQTAMPVAQENAIVQKYCAVCHTDASLNGGLSLEHFDAAHADPGVAAMLISKLTSGLTPRQIEASHHDPAIGALVVKKMGTGAMGAAGLGVPDRATQDALLSALAVESADADRWTLNTSARTLTASILREAPSTKNAGDTDMYRLILTCNADTQEAQVRLNWSPGVPDKTKLVTAAVDGREPVAVRIEGTEKWGNGMGSSGPATILLPVALPAKTLTVSNLFPNETVEFPFDGLPATARQSLSVCFSGK